LDKNIEYESIKEITYSVENNILKKIELFDVYVGENIPQNKKSYAISFTFVDKNKTLTDNKVDQVINKLIIEFKKKLNAEIRK
jgi:phenylalanyl-tRNA synthetase beta chain